MMRIFFGLNLDDYIPSPKGSSQGKTLYLGQNGLLSFLENRLGLSGHTNNIEYIRVEQYRQAILKHLTTGKNHFYTKSFEADDFATAAALLDRRDELLLSGWDFKIDDNCPERLRIISELEGILKSEEDLFLPAGFADRFIDVLSILDKIKHPIEKIFLTEPIELLPDFFKKLFDKLKTTSVYSNFSLEILNSQHGITRENEDFSDLEIFQNAVLSKNTATKSILKNDGSLIIIRAKRETDAAVFLAKTLDNNSGFHPTLLITEPNLTLDNAIVNEGLPGLGLLSVSLARPTLQILKLISAFLWEPADPYKILEFVALPVKPIDDDLAKVIAKQISAKPGIKGEGWYSAINGFFDDLKNDISEGLEKDFDKIRKQYNFWFERKRFSIDKKVPKDKVIDIFAHLVFWSRETYENIKNPSLIVLKEQARRIKELLESIPEISLSNLELERIVRTIYEPAPVIFRNPETGHYPVITNSGNVFTKTEQLVWWNFIQNEPVHFFSRWYQNERDALINKGVRLDSPADENSRLLFHRYLPVINTKEQLILVIPEMVTGTKVNPHPLLGDLLATFENIEKITLNIDDFENVNDFAKHFSYSDYQNLKFTPLDSPKPFLSFGESLKFPEREYETYTSLETLFYYPYQWFFKHIAKLHQSALLSVVRESTLKGNLAHRLFEKFFKENNMHFNKNQLNQWVEKNAADLFLKEGTVFLLYGHEPERTSFVNRIKYSLWALLSILKSNEWEVAGTEQKLEGKFAKIPVKGIADMVLTRGNEKAIVDLKWRGTSHRKRTIGNEEDLQLVLYTDLLNGNPQIPHSAYFIIEEGKMIARNNQAFKEAIAVLPDDDSLEIHRRILKKMEKTFLWRQEQIKNGEIEVRTEQTALEIENIYDDRQIDMLQLLEMKEKDSYFDDFRVLINLLPE